MAKRFSLRGGRLVLSVFGLALSMAGRTILADGFSSDSVVRVLAERISEGRIAIVLRIHFEAPVDVLIRESIPDVFVASSVSDGGVVAGQLVQWHLPQVQQGMVSYELNLVSSPCDDEFPLGPGTFEVNGIECPITGAEGGRCDGDLPPQGKTFRRGDLNASGVVNITDPVALLIALFLGGNAPACADAADADDNGALGLTDAIMILNHLFLGGPPTADPGPQNCGPDAVDELPDLGCDAACP